VKIDNALAQWTICVLQSLLMQIGFFRPHNRFCDVKGFYLVGAGTHSSAGGPSVTMSADLTTQMIFDDIEKGL
jgi:phytoene desaturase